MTNPKFDEVYNAASGRSELRQQRRPVAERCFAGRTASLPSRSFRSLGRGRQRDFQREACRNGCHRRSPRASGVQDGGTRGSDPHDGFVNHEARDDGAYECENHPVDIHDRLGLSKR